MLKFEAISGHIQVAFCGFLLFDWLGFFFSFGIYFALKFSIFSPATGDESISSYELCCLLGLFFAFNHKIPVNQGWGKPSWIVELAVKATAVGIPLSLTPLLLPSFFPQQLNKNTLCTAFYSWSFYFGGFSCYIKISFYIKKLFTIFPK